jgi:tetratricopeptide (TPR) repeat protein
MSFLWPEHRERSDWFEIQQADLPTMVRFIADQQQVALYRASLLEQQAGTIGRVAPKIILQQLQSPDPLMRESSWKAATNLQPSDLHGQAMIGLQDTHLSVRLAAFEALMLAGALPSKPTRVRAEYEAYLQQQSDRPAGRTLIGRYARISGDSAVAEQHFKIALEMDNAYLPAYILLTDLLRNQQRFVDAIASLNNGLDQLPENSSLWHLRGLTWLQLKKHEEALGDLGKAARLAPDNWLFSYRYALVSLRLGHIEQAQQAAVTLSEIAPDNPQVKALLKEIQAKKQNKPL